MAGALTLCAQDLGQQINAWYAAAPEGGVFRIEQSASFSTPICFCTPGKRVLLVGLPGDMVNITYTGTGTALIFDYGMGHAMGHGIRDLTLTGPGSSTNTVGVQFGGGNGAEGIAFENFKVQGFGSGVAMGSHTWLARFAHGMIRDNGMNLLLPSGQVEAGEQIEFDHVTFADAPPPHENSVWVQGPNQEVVFRDCSFDQAQVRIGNGASSSAQVVITGSHFENPNAAVAGSVPYVYLVIDPHLGNLVRLTDSYFFQGSSTSAPDHFVDASGGSVIMSGVGMYSAARMSHFAELRNGATLEYFGFRDLSGQFATPRFQVVTPPFATPHPRPRPMKRGWEE